MTRTAILWLPCLALSFIQGCATVSEAVLGPPLEARWYFTPAPVASKSETASSSKQPRTKDSPPQIEIVLVNRSAREIEIRNVFLNQYDQSRDRHGSKTWAWE